MKKRSSHAASSKATSTPAAAAPAASPPPGSGPNASARKSTATKPAENKAPAAIVSVGKDLDLARLELLFAGLVAEPLYDEKGRVAAGGAHLGHPPAVMAAVKVLERRAKLLGLDAPVKLKAEVNRGLKGMTDEELLALKEKLRG